MEEGWSCDDEDVSSSWEGESRRRRSLSERSRLTRMSRSSGRWETSSQVARSILGGLVNTITSKIGEKNEEEEQEDGVSLMEVFEGAHLSEDELDELEITSEEFGAQRNEEVEQVVSIEDDQEKDVIVDDTDEVDFETKLIDLDETRKSFKTRMSDWINSARLNQAEGENDEEEKEEKEEDSEVFGTSTPLPSSVHNTHSSPMKENTDSCCSQIDEEQKMEECQQEDAWPSFHSNSRGISFSMLPSLAFASYEAGFSRARQNNLVEDNSLARRRTLRPNGEQGLHGTRCEFLKVTETMEQKVVVEKDGRRVVHTKTSREEEQGSKMSGVLRMLINIVLLLLLVGGVFAAATVWFPGVRICGVLEQEVEKIEVISVPI